MGISQRGCPWNSTWSLLTLLLHFNVYMMTDLSSGKEYVILAWVVSYYGGTLVSLSHFLIFFGVGMFAGCFCHFVLQCPQEAWACLEGSGVRWGEKSCCSVCLPDLFCNACLLLDHNTLASPSGMPVLLSVAWHHWFSAVVHMCTGPHYVPSFSSTLTRSLVFLCRTLSLCASPASMPSDSWISSPRLSSTVRRAVSVHPTSMITCFANIHPLLFWFLSWTLCHFGDFVWWNCWNFWALVCHPSDLCLVLAAKPIVKRKASSVRKQTRQSSAPVSPISAGPDRISGDKIRGSTSAHGFSRKFVAGALQTSNLFFCRISCKLGVIITTWKWGCWRREGMFLCGCTEVHACFFEAHMKEIHILWVCWVLCVNFPCGISPELLAVVLTPSAWLDV